MDFLPENLKLWLTANAVQLIVTIAVLALYLLLDRFSTPRLEESADQGRFKDNSANSAIRTARLITGVFGALVLVIVWGIEIGAVLIFATTTITLLGVALFASWSLLSNVTAYFILLMHPSFRRGTFVRVIDLDNYVEGYISELTLFNTKLVTERREIVVYPNSQLLGKPALINPRDRLSGIGKILPERTVAEDEDR